MPHDEIRGQYDEVQAEGLYEEGMARMALYHRHCQDPVIFRALGEVVGRSLLDLACGDGFYTRKFRRAGPDPVLGIDLSPQQVATGTRECCASCSASRPPDHDITVPETSVPKPRSRNGRRFNCSSVCRSVPIVMPAGVRQRLRLPRTLTHAGIRFPALSRQKISTLAVGSLPKSTVPSL